MPALAAESAAGSAGLGEGVALYHMVLEGIVFAAPRQRALLDDLADGRLPGVREGLQRVELDERWHISFGLRCLVESRNRPQPCSRTCWRGPGEVAGAWGDAVPPATLERIAPMCARRCRLPGWSRRGRRRSQAAVAPALRERSP